MTRTFERSTRRRRRRLDGLWDFAVDPDDEGTSENWAESFPTDADALPVPGTWNARSQYADYVGPAWYRREFTLPTATSVVLTFQGVGHASTVYLDGEEILAIEGGYTPSWTYVRDLDAGSHELVVRADNSPDATPLAPRHWYPQGGIYRDVVLEEVSGLWVSDLAVEYELDGEDAEVEATVTVHNVAPSSREGTVLVSVGDETAEVTTTVGGLDAKRHDVDLTLVDVDRWSPEDPTLYDVVVAVRDEDGGDDLHDRIGFRDVSVDGDDVLVNGDPVDLAAVNRHEDHPDWGHADPLGRQVADLDSITDAGFDAVRCAEYPVDPRFLDLCDEAGLLVVGGLTPSNVGDVSADRYTDPADAVRRSFDPDDPGEDEPVSLDVLVDEMEVPSEAPEPEVDSHDVVEAIRRVATELVERDRHHPSVVAWDVGSDHESGTGLREAASQLRGTVRGLDDSRLLTATVDADALTDDPAHFEHLDLASVRIGRISPDTPAGVLDDVDGDRVDGPLFVAGVGAVGVPGERRIADRPGSESAQAAALAGAIETIQTREDFAGFAVDRLADPGIDAGVVRIPGSGYTGVTTATREPKAAYDAVRRLLD